MVRHADQHGPISDDHYDASPLELDKQGHATDLCTQTSSSGHQGNEEMFSFTHAQEVSSDNKIPQLIWDNRYNCTYYVACTSQMSVPFEFDTYIPT